MSSSRELYASNADGSYRPMTNTAQGYARNLRHAQYPPIASHGTAELHQDTSQTWQRPPVEHMHRHAGRRQTSTDQVAYSGSYVQSNYTTYQGSSRGFQQYDEHPGSQYRPNFSGDQYAFEDPRRRTARFVDDGQQNWTGGRYASSGNEAEWSGMGQAANAIERFDNHFSVPFEANAEAQGAQGGNRSFTRAQHDRTNDYVYPRTIDYPTQNGGSSTQR
ncbi:hypothetical protein ACHAPU_009178 [Fusarium lateritium]